MILTMMQAARALQLGLLRQTGPAVRLNSRAAQSAKLITIRGASVQTTAITGRTVTKDQQQLSQQPRRGRPILTITKAATALQLGLPRPTVPVVRLNSRAAQSAKPITIRGASVQTTTITGLTVTRQQCCAAL